MAGLMALLFILSFSIFHFACCTHENATVVSQQFPVFFNKKLNVTDLSTLRRIIEWDVARMKAAKFAKTNRDVDVQHPVQHRPGGGLNYIHVNVGNLPQELVLDTGSSITWIQCEPCLLCYSQECDLLAEHNRVCRAGVCKYFVGYADGFNTTGRWGSDFFDERRAIFGCGNLQMGLDQEVSSGLVGLGAGATSLFSQWTLPSNRVFSYCLPSEADEMGYLKYGGNPFLPQVLYDYIPLQVEENHYFVEVYDISVDGQLLGIQPITVKKNEEGKVIDGMVFDTGSELGFLREDVYKNVRKAYRNKINLPLIPSVMGQVDTCYLDSPDAFDLIPNIIFHFIGGTTIHLPPQSSTWFVQGDDGYERFCLAFATSITGTSTLGQKNQKGLDLVFDLNKKRLGVAVGEHC